MGMRKTALLEEREMAYDDRLMVTVFLFSMSLAVTVIVGVGARVSGVW